MLMGKNNYYMIWSKNTMKEKLDKTVFSVFPNPENNTTLNNCFGCIIYAIIFVGIILGAWGIVQWILM